MIKLDIKEKVIKALHSFEERLASIRSGRASPLFLESVRVEIYGSKMNLKEVASVSILDNFTLSVKPYDSSAANDVNKAIQESGLGVNPILEGSIIRVPLPKMTEDRRKELAKVADQYKEDAKVSIRNIRRDEMDSLKKFEKAKEISEDELRRMEKDVDKECEIIIKKIDELTESKKSDILKV